MNDIQGWTTMPLSSLIADIGDGGTPSTSRRDYWGGDIPWVVIQDIRQEISSTKTSLTHLGLKSCSAKRWPAGAVILSTGATIGEVGIAKIPLATKQGIHGIVCRNSFSNRFLFYKLQSLKAHLNANAQGSTIREVRAPFLLTIQIKHPVSLREQAKIAEVLSTVDRAIEETEALIAKQQRIKTGLMQDLLTRGIDEHGNLRSEQTHEFKNSPLGRIPVEWDVKPIEQKLDRIIDYRGRTPTKVEAGVPLLTAKNVRDGYIDEEPRESIAESAFDSWMTRGIPEPGDVLFTTEAPMGNVARVPAYRIALAQRLLTLCPKAGELSQDYLFWLLHWRRSTERLELLTSGSTVVGVKQSVFRKVVFLFPRLREQNQISEALNSHQQESVHQKARLRKLHALKTGLMQDLLTGNRRVTALLEQGEKATA